MPNKMQNCAPREINFHYRDRSVEIQQSISLKIHIHDFPFQIQTPASKRINSVVISATTVCCNMGYCTDVPV